MPIKIRNIGPVSQHWLESVGVKSREDLQRIGAVEVYFQIKKRVFSPSLNLLWALEGAIQDIPFYAVSVERKKQLREQLRKLESAN